MVSFGLVSCGVVSFGFVWFHFVGFCLVWFHLVSFGLVSQSTVSQMKVSFFLICPNLVVLSWIATPFKSVFSSLLGILVISYIKYFSQVFSNGSGSWVWTRAYFKIPNKGW